MPRLLAIHEYRFVPDADAVLGKRLEELGEASYVVKIVDLKATPPVESKDGRTWLPCKPWLIRALGKPDAGPLINGWLDHGWTSERTTLVSVLLDGEDFMEREAAARRPRSNTWCERKKAARMANSVHQESPELCCQHCGYLYDIHHTARPSVCWGCGRPTGINPTAHLDLG